jgi:hypothetical protein
LAIVALFNNSVCRKVLLMTVGGVRLHLLAEGGGCASSSLGPHGVVGCKW